MFFWRSPFRFPTFGVSRHPYLTHVVFYLQFYFIDFLLHFFLVFFALHIMSRVVIFMYCDFFHEIRCCPPVLLLFHKGLILMLLCDVHFFLLKKPLPRQLRAMQTKGQTKATCKLTEIVHMCLTKDCLS